MRESDDLDRLRVRADDDQAHRTVPPGLTTRGAPSMVARTKTVGTYPTVAARYYACSPVRVTGPETEGATGTKTADTSTTIYAYNLGTSIPPSGTDVPITFVNSRWVFRYD